MRPKRGLDAKKRHMEGRRPLPNVSATALREKLRYELFFVFSTGMSIPTFPRFAMINAINSHITPLTPKPDPISIQHIKNMELIRKRLAKA